MQIEKTQIEKRLENFPLYFKEPDASLHISENKGNIYIGYLCGKRHTKEDAEKATYFNVQITDKTFYILSIGIDEACRGVGLGFKLYQILEEIAQDFECDRIEMTPSGTCEGGETRESYVCRKLGYKPISDSIAVFKELK